MSDEEESQPEFYPFCPLTKPTSKAIKRAILYELKMAGYGGLKIKELSERAGLPQRIISSWISNHLHQTPKIERMSYGKYVIKALERELAAAIESQPPADVQTLLETPNADPLERQIDQHVRYHTPAIAVKVLQARRSRLWADEQRSAWVRKHHAELCELLEKLINERCSQRAAFRDAAGTELGRLTTAIVKADGDNAPDAVLGALNEKMASLEDTLADREAQLRSAHAATRSFKASAAMADTYQTLFSKWQQAREAAAGLNFEISEVPLCLVETQA